MKSGIENISMLTPLLFAFMAGAACIRIFTELSVEDMKLIASLSGLALFALLISVSMQMYLANKSPRASELTELSEKA